MKYLVTKLFLSSLLITLIFNCQSIRKNYPYYKGEEITFEKKFTVMNSFTVLVPENWTISEKYELFYVLTITSPKIGENDVFNERIELLGLSQANGISLDEYGKAMYEMLLKGKVKDYSVLRTFPLNDGYVKYAEVESTENNIRIKQVYYFFIAGDGCYAIICTAPTNMYDKYITYFDGFVSSFKI